MNESDDNLIQSGGANGFAANLSWLVFSGAVSIANSILVWIFMARWRDAEELGRFTIVMGLYALFYNICSLNLSTHLVREISRRSAKTGGNIQEFIGTSAIFLTIAGAVCAVLMTIGGFVLSDAAEVRSSTAILSFALVPTAVIALGEAKALAFGRGRLIATVTTLENVLRTVAPLFLIAFGFPMWAICLSFVAVRIVAAAIYFLIDKFDFAFAKKEFTNLLKVAPTFAGTIIFASLNWQLPLILLARLATESESARYGVASRFLIPAAILAAGFANAMQPALVREWEKSVAAGANYLWRRARLISVLTVAAAIVSPFLSRAVLEILFGAGYADSARVLDLLAISVVPFALVLITARGLVAANEARIDFLANVVGAAVCFAAGLFLIPRYGASGAATAQVTAFFVMAIVEIAFLASFVRAQISSAVTVRA